MRKIILVLVNIITIGVFAQKSVSINEDFSGLKISAGIQVKLITDAVENKIVADERVFEAINYKVREDQLKISSSIETLLEGEVPLNIELHVVNLNNINVVKGSGLEIDNKIKTNNLTLRAGEGSRITGSIEVESLDVTVVSGGFVYLKGNTNNQRIGIKTGGQYEGRKLKSEDTFIKVSYGGEAEVHASKNCEAKVIVGGIIDIYGKPEFLNEKTNFGGEINLR